MKPGMTVWAVGLPAGLAGLESDLPPGAVLRRATWATRRTARTGDALALWFVRSRAELAEHVASAARLVGESATTKRRSNTAAAGPQASVRPAGGRPMPGLAGVASGLWICWPKKSGALASDLSDRDVRDAGLAAGLVDYKVCAVDADWSGLKFARRAGSTPAAR